MNITSDELKTSCVVCSHKGMQNSILEKVKLSTKMIRDPTMVVWQEKQVTCFRFDPPANAFKNIPASLVMGRTIVGNAILMGNGLTAESIAAAVEAARPTFSSWSSLAAQLPKEVKLDEKALQRKQLENEEKMMVWNEYLARKKNKEVPLIFEDEPEDDLFN